METLLSQSSLTAACTRMSCYSQNISSLCSAGSGEAEVGGPQAKAGTRDRRRAAQQRRCRAGGRGAADTGGGRLVGGADSDADGPPQGRPAAVRPPQAPRCGGCSAAAAAGRDTYHPQRPPARTGAKNHCHWCATTHQIHTISFAIYLCCCLRSILPK